MRVLEAAIAPAPKGSHAATVPDKCYATANAIVRSRRARTSPTTTKRNLTTTRRWPAPSEQTLSGVVGISSASRDSIGTERLMFGEKRTS